MAKKVAVVFTGGTISMKVDPRLKVLCQWSQTLIKLLSLIL